MKRQRDQNRKPENKNNIYQDWVYAKGRISNQVNMEGVKTVDGTTEADI